MVRVRSGLTRGLAVLLALVLVGCASLGGSGTGAADGRTASPAELRAQALDLLNATRAEHGLPPVVRDAAADTAAEAWSRSLADPRDEDADAAGGGASGASDATTDPAAAAASAGAGDTPAADLNAELRRAHPDAGAVASAWVSGTAGIAALHDRLAASASPGPGMLGDHDLVGIGVAQGERGAVWLTYAFVQSGSLRQQRAVEALPADPAGHTLELINATRAGAGLPPLRRDPRADQVAQAWTDHMSASGILAHSPHYGQQLAAAFPDLAASAENVGYSSEGLDDVHRGFVGSPGHYANLVGDFEVIGIGVRVDASGVTWVTHNLVRLRR